MQDPATRILEDEDTDRITAVWPDGFRWQVPGVTLANYKIQRGNHRQAGSLAVHWSSTDESVTVKDNLRHNKHSYIVWQTDDHGKKGQKMELKTDGLSAEAIESARKFVLKQAQRLAAGTTDQAAMKVAKYEYMKKHPPEPAKRKPACAMKGKKRKKPPVDDDDEAEEEGEEEEHQDPDDAESSGSDVVPSGSDDDENEEPEEEDTPAPKAKAKAKGKGKAEARLKRRPSACGDDSGAPPRMKRPAAAAAPATPPDAGTTQLDKGIVRIPIEKTEKNKLLRRPAAADPNTSEPDAKPGSGAKSSNRSIPQPEPIGDLMSDML